LIEIIFYLGIFFAFFSHYLFRIAKRMVPVVLQPRVCRNVAFTKSTSSGRISYISLSPSSSAPLRLVSQMSRPFGHRIGVMFAANSCCASGVNDVLAGIIEYLAEWSEGGLLREYELLGLVGGPKGYDGEDNIVNLKNDITVHGLELIGYSSFSGLDLEEISRRFIDLGLTSLVVCAASDELESAVRLSALFPQMVIVPQSRNQHVLIAEDGLCSTSLGFDSARRVLAELAGNIAIDCMSSKKYWHFINCGDAALVAEVGLLIRANEIVTEHGKSLTTKEWIGRVCDLIVSRATSGPFSRSGVVMVSQCAFVNTNEMEKLREEISAIEQFPVPEHVAKKKLSKPSLEFLELLPKSAKTSLLRRRDRTGEPFVSYWSPEEFLMNAVRVELSRRETLGLEFAFRTHFLAHESRCPVPTKFDSRLGSALGRTAAALATNNHSGYLVSIKGLKTVGEWIPVGVKLNSDGIITQKGYSIPESVAAAMAYLLPRWQGQPGRYRSFGPVQPDETDDRLTPLSLLEESSVVKYLDPTGWEESGLLERQLRSLSPPIQLPLRRVEDMSPYELTRLTYTPKSPDFSNSSFQALDLVPRVDVSAALAAAFPHSCRISGMEVKMDECTASALPVPSSPPKIGIVFMCSQVPGCHNVVWGLADYWRSRFGESADVIGFLGGGSGLINKWFHAMDRETVDVYRNQGGQDLLGHFGESLESVEDLENSERTIRDLGLSGLVIVGNLAGQMTAGLLNERIMKNGGGRGSPCVISVPCSAENEIPFIRQSIGCDTLTRVFSTTVSNLFTEARASRTRWYFVRLMSHHVSHLALGVALATHPNIVLVTEEVSKRRQSLEDITVMIADCIIARAARGKGYGVVLIPDGVAAVVPEIRRLLRELDKIMEKDGSLRKSSNSPISIQLEIVQAQLSRVSCGIFQQLPRFVQEGFLTGDMRHRETGKIDIANVAMERILQTLVERKLEQIPSPPSIHVHSLAYQGRSSAPTDLDCDLAYTCGGLAGLFVAENKTGLVVDGSRLSGLPIVSMIRATDSVLQIDPTSLLMSGNRCRSLLELLPAPVDREGRRDDSGNEEAWEMFQSVSADCESILAAVNCDDEGLMESVLRSLEILVKNVKAVGASAGGEAGLATELHSDILSTCAPRVGLETVREDPFFLSHI
jgi:diphosphate--fructose-6-phosphate 1-phosphotransferase